MKGDIDFYFRTGVISLYIIIGLLFSELIVVLVILPWIILAAILGRAMRAFEHKVLNGGDC